MKLKKPSISTSINICPKKDPKNISNEEINVAVTKESLLSGHPEPMTASETDVQCCLEKQSRLGPWIGYSIAILLLGLGISTVIYTPFDLAMDLRLEMTPGLPPYDWWKTPPDEVLFRVYIFNITNSEEFLNGTETKLRFNEIGPIVFMEKLIHSNITFNNNGTMTYTATRKEIYLPDSPENKIDLNSTIIVPNMAVLGMASYLTEAPFFAKFGFNLMVRRLDSQPIKKVTIYEYLYNNSEPILELSKKIAPSLVPTHNTGVLSEIYNNFKDVVTVKIGEKNGNDNFFLIDNYDGSERLPGYNKKCLTSVQNSTEGVSYPQFLNKKSVLKYWRKSLCKVVDLYYEKDVSWRGINAYKFSLPPNTYYRTQPSLDDCFQGYPSLPNGLIDVSPCYYDLPVAAGFPHYLHADKALLEGIDGLKPEVDRHSSFVLVEPTTGIPLHSRARSQSSLIVKDMSGFTNRLQPFSNMILPMCYIEYSQVGLPWYIYFLLYFTVNVLPIFQKAFSAICIIVGVLIFAIFLRKKRRHRQHLLENKKLNFETEAFIKV